MLIVRIKAMCKTAGISRLDVGPKGATMQFHNDKFANPAGLVDFVKAQGPAARIAGNKIVLVGEMKTEADRIKGAFNIARDLAEKWSSRGRDQLRLPFSARGSRRPGVASDQRQRTGQHERPAPRSSAGSAVPLKARPTGTASTDRQHGAECGDQRSGKARDMAQILHRHGAEVAQRQAHHGKDADGPQDMGRKASVPRA